MYVWPERCVQEPDPVSNEPVGARPESKGRTDSSAVSLRLMIERVITDRTWAYSLNQHSRVTPASIEPAITDWTTDWALI